MPKSNKLENEIDLYEAFVAALRRSLDGEPPASVLKVINDFLKDQGISADSKSNKDVAALADKFAAAPFDPEDEQQEARH